MAYFYNDWKHKKMTVEREDGQFLFNFGEAEISMVDSIKKAIANTKADNGEMLNCASYMKMLLERLEKGQIEVKWNIS